MPKYDYKCSECGHSIEVDHSMDDSYVGYVCEIPTCEGSLRKIFSATPGHFKGQGWGKTYRVHKPKGE